MNDAAQRASLLPQAGVLCAKRAAFRMEAMLTAEDHYFNALDHFAAGDLVAAIGEYKNALEKDPAFTDAMHGLIRAYQDADQLDAAIAAANKLAELDPNDILAHTSLSILYQKKGMVPEAEAEANKARVLGWKQQLKEGKGK